MPQNITQHIAAIDAEGELDEAATCEPYLQVRTEGARQTQRPQIAKTRPKNRLRD